MLTALLRDRTRASADFDRLYGVDAHERVGDVGVQAIEHGLTQPRRHASGNDGAPRPDRIPLAPDFPHQRLELGNARGVWAEEWVLIGKRRLDRIECQL